MVLVSCLSLQVPRVIAIERNVEYTTWGCRYELYVQAPDTWQIDKSLEVTVRLTWSQKWIEDRGIEYVTSNSKMLPFLKLQIRTHTDDVTWFLRYYDAFVNLTEDGDFWEKQFRLETPSQNVDKLGRGDIADSTLSAILRLEEYGANHTLLNSRAIVGGSIMKINVFKPLLSTIETYVAGGFGAVIAFGLLVLGLNRSGRFSLCRLSFHDWRDLGYVPIYLWKGVAFLEDPSHPHGVSKLRKENKILSNSERKCRYCGLHQKRKFTTNEAGVLEVGDWETVYLATDPRII